MNAIGVRDILTLLNLPGIGRKTASEALRINRQNPGTSIEIDSLLDFARKRLPKIPLFSKAQIKSAGDKADEILDDSARLGLGIHCYGAPGFPRRLQDIPDAPLVLYTKGNASALQARLSVAIVGTRKPTDWGARSADRIAVRLTKAGFVVVSGLAAGCDTMAHRGCLSAGGSTVAVLAHGLQMVYPSSNRGLAESILDNRGCLVSEYAPGLRGQPGFFVERDRIQSGLSIGVIVVETRIDGGTMHTVKACRDQGRALACIVHPPHRPHPIEADGNDAIIAKGGAFSLKDAEDIERLIAHLTAVADDSTFKKPDDSPPLGQDSLFDVREY